jgi:parvulin-like peptidyl-prolyl isomerase
VCWGGAAGEEPAPPKDAAAPRDEGAAARAPADGPPSGELAPGVLARLNGRDIRVDEYAGYLLASLGKSRLDEYIDRLLLEEEAKRLEVAVSPEEVEASVEERIDRTVKGLYKGAKENYLANLARRRTTLEEEKARLRQERYYELLREKVILKTREVGDDAMRRQFETAYGEDGVKYVLRHILISWRAVPGGEPKVAAAGGEPARTKAEARERAEKVLKELQAGGDFAQAAKQYSDEPRTRDNEGRIPTYRKNFYGEDFHQAVLQLTPERPLSGIVETPRGFHLIQLVEKQVTQLDSVRAEVEKAVRTQPPSAAERLELTKRLRDKAKIEGL